MAGLWSFAFDSRRDGAASTSSPEFPPASSREPVLGTSTPNVKCMNRRPVAVDACDDVEVVECVEEVRAREELGIGDMLRGEGVISWGLSIEGKGGEDAKAEVGTNSVFDWLSTVLKAGVVLSVCE